MSSALNNVYGTHFICELSWTFRVDLCHDSLRGGSRHTCYPGLIRCLLTVCFDNHVGFAQM